MIQILSATSFGIYLIHPIILNALRIKEININPIYMVPLTALSAFLISFVIIYIISKVPIIKNIVP